jgi:outer membrane lipoprotein-sorting protein
MKKMQLMTIALLLQLTAAFAEETLSGIQIMENVHNRPTGQEIQSELTMTLTNSRGSSRVREISQFIKEFGSDEKKIMFFTSPADVKGTSFMTWSYDKNNDDDMWIYLPALKKTKRISSDSKSDYFMGSDFTYDDMGDRHPSEDTHTILRQETFEGQECYVVESRSIDIDYFYSKTITWVVKDEWIGLKKEFYDEDGDFLKALTVNKYEKINGYWVITSMKMTNEQKDHTTTMELENVRIDEGINDNQFTERMMERGIR